MTATQDQTAGVDCSEPGILLPMGMSRGSEQPLYASNLRARARADSLIAKIAKIAMNPTEDGFPWHDRALFITRSRPVIAALKLYAANAASSRGGSRSGATKRVSR